VVNKINIELKLPPRVTQTGYNIVHHITHIKDAKGFGNRTGLSHQIEGMGALDGTTLSLHTA
jgi:hypothetical protein